MFNDFEVKMNDKSDWELKYVHVFKGIFISESENDYKKGPKFRFELEPDNSFEISEDCTHEKQK